MTGGHRLELDDSNFFTQAIGEGGVSETELTSLEPRLQGLAQRLAKWQKGAEPSFFHLPFEPQHLESVREWGSQIAGAYERLVVLGMGGSSLGGEMLVRCLGGSEAQGRVIFLDNVDPIGIQERLAGIHWPTTMVLAVSKSGNTAETLAQLLTLIPRIERALGSRRLPDHLAILTEAPNGALAQLGRQWEAPVIPHPPVGGRYSVLSPVGLLPAYIAGVDVEALVNGAARMAECCLKPYLDENPAFYGGGAQYLLAQKGKTQSVVMPYTDRLYQMASWFRQLWAESLGKQDEAGHPHGLTPVPALGATDQHSQLQLYLQGPADKQFTLFYTGETILQGERVPPRLAEPSAVTPLAGHSLGELLLAELFATQETLTRSGRPNRTIRLPMLEAEALGELIMLLETETVVVAELLGVNPFDQPAVEESKVLARQYLARMEEEPFFQEGKATPSNRSR